MKKKSSTALPEMQYYFNKKKNKKEFISIIEDKFMIVFTVKKQQVDISFSFDQEAIRTIKMNKYEKISVEKGIQYAVNITSYFETQIDEKIIQGAEILMKELSTVSLKKSMERKIEKTNCCHGG